MLEINNTLTKIKNAFGVLLSRLDITEKKKMMIEIFKTEKQREKRRK